MATTACSVGTFLRLLYYPGSPEGLQDRARHPSRGRRLSNSAGRVCPRIARPGPETTPQAPSAPQGGAPTSSSLMASMGSAIIMALNSQWVRLLWSDAGGWGGNFPPPGNNAPHPPHGRALEAHGGGVTGSDVHRVAECAT